MSEPPDMGPLAARVIGYAFVLRALVETRELTPRQRERAQARAWEHLTDALDALEAADPAMHAGFAAMVAAIVEQVRRELPPE